MPEVYIPFTKGQSEAVDSKLLPQGLFVSAQNVRYAKDARLGARAAYRASAASGAPTPNNVVGAGAFAAQHEVLITKRASITAPAFATRHGTNGYKGGSATTQPQSSSISSLGVPTRSRVGAGMLPLASAQTVGQCDSMAAGNYLFVAWGDNALSIFDLATNAQVGTAALGTGFVSQRILLLGGLVCIFAASTASGQIRLWTINPSTLVITAIGVVVSTAILASARYFDVADGASATSAYLCYCTSANTITFGTITAAGVFAALSTVTTVSITSKTAICAGGINPTDDVAIAWNDADLGRYTIYRRSTTTFTTPTAAFTGAAPIGYPVIAPNGANDIVVAANIAGPFVFALVRVTGEQPAFSGRLASKPFSANGGTFLVVNDVDAPGGTPAVGTYYVYDVNSVINASLLAPNTNQCEAVFAIDAAMPANAAVDASDQRRRFVSTTALGSEPGLTAAIGALPVQSSLDAGFDIFRFESGDRAESFQTAKLNNQLFFSGARVTEYDGKQIVESGFVARPVLSLSSVSAGTLPAGTYQYVGVWEWFDAGGRRHLSAPSLPLTVVLASAGTPNIAYTAPNATSKMLQSPDLNGPSLLFNNFTATLRLYRTAIAPGTVFRDTANTGLSLTAPSPYADSTLDATLASREILYTQGAQGGLSGLLEHNPPPAARYIWAGSDRLIVGGLERRSAVQWSLLRVEGEPLQWSNYDGLKAQVDGVVTAVAEMDGTWFIATYNNWWQVVGQGPDNNGGGGSFDAPRRLPSDIGCISAKSLLLTGKGLMFQGRSDGMFLLPRGGGEPIPIGWQVRDTLAAFPVVAASAFDQDSNVAYWAVVDSTASSGRLIVFDTRLGEWYVDNFLSRAIKTLSIYNGLLVIDGAIVETPGNYQDSDGSTTASVVPSLTTGDVRPFGMTGRGKARKIQLEGEARDVTTAFSVTLDVSYDSGVSFTEPVFWPIASLAAGVGGAIEGAEHTLKYPKGDKWRFRLSWSTPSATEGIVWSGLSLEIFQERGLQRVANSRRA